MPTSAAKNSTGRPTCAPSIASTQTGDFVEGFIAVALLHDGPWSKVYRARASGSREEEAGQYVIKMASTDNAHAVTAENMLRREARVMQSVAQPHVAPLLDHQLTQRPFHLLTPYLEGATLADVFDANLRVPPAHALWITRQIAQALDALSAAGWLHGDIKPANIHVAPTGHATLMDFGLARRIGHSSRTASQPAITGTLKYMAPECFRTDSVVDERSDLYSLGALLYQLLSGHPPFVAPNAASFMDAHLHASPPALQLPHCAIAMDVRELVAQLLAKDPLRRPQSADELARRLMRLEIAMMAERLSAAA